MESVESVESAKGLQGIESYLPSGELGRLSLPGLICWHRALLALTMPPIRTPDSVSPCTSIMSQSAGIM